jgi:hypothetical protein
VEATNTVAAPVARREWRREDDGECTVDTLGVVSLAVAVLGHGNTVLGGMYWSAVTVVSRDGGGTHSKGVGETTAAPIPVGNRDGPGIQVSGSAATRAGPVGQGVGEGSR